MKFASLPHQAHIGLNFCMLSFLIGFFISSPLFPSSSKPVPVVKSAFTSTVPVPRHNTDFTPTTTAQAVFIIDLDSQTVLLAKQPNLRLSPASLTKIMTAIIAMDNYDPNTQLNVYNGELSLGAKAELISGDILTAKDTLFALLIPSGNDAAITLAENFSGGYTKFVQQMNQKASQLKLTNTHFSNVSGLEGTTHFTSAYDISIIAQHALERPLFRQIVSTKHITLKSEKGYIYPLETTNLLLGKPGVFGVKTGWTDAAGECLVTYAIREGHPILISLLGSQDRFGETESLLEWVYSDFIWE